MQCPQCNTANEKGAQFCSECGATLVADKKSSICPSCGETHGPADAFCQSCGYVLSEKKGPKAKTSRGKLTSRDERYHQARQLAVKKLNKQDMPENTPAPIIYIGEKI